LNMHARRSVSARARRKNWAQSTLCDFR
jgi:hypothetical protein